MTAILNSSEVYFNGDLELYGHKFAAATLDVSSSGFAFSSSADIPYAGAISVVGDGAKCGFETITNGAKCGYSEVSQVVTSAADCGVQTITNGAKCGYKTVTSASECGVQTITSGAQCGWSIISSGWNCIAHGNCKSPKSCSVPRSCSVALSCDIPATCTIEVKKAKSCQIPKSCDIHIDGSLTAGADMNISTSGISGDVSAKFCIDSSDCLSVSGEVEIDSSKVQACVNLPDLGKACGGFN